MKNPSELHVIYKQLITIRDMKKVILRVAVLLLSLNIMAQNRESYSVDEIEKGWKTKTIDNVILTPHIGGLSYEAFHQMMHDAMENIKTFEEKRS